jgi:hypothetical protein
MCLSLQNFMLMLDQARGNGALSPSTLAVMGRMCGLFGLGLMEAGVGDLLEGGWISGEFYQGLINQGYKCNMLYF